MSIQIKIKQKLCVFVIYLSNQSNNNKTVAQISNKGTDRPIHCLKILKLGTHDKAVECWNHYNYPDRLFGRTIGKYGNLASLRDIYGYGNNIFINFLFLTLKSIRFVTEIHPPILLLVIDINIIETNRRKEYEKYRLIFT